MVVVYAFLSGQQNPRFARPAHLALLKKLAKLLETHAELGSPLGKVPPFQPLPGGGCVCVF